MDWSRFQLVSLTVIAGLVAARALLLWFTVHVNAFKVSRPSELAYFAAAAFFVLLLLRGAPFDRTIVGSDAFRGAGASLVVFGILIFVLALFSFGNSWRVGIDTQTPGQLVTEGIFKFSRNPIFVFIDLYLVGTFLLNGTIVFLLIAVAGIIALHLQILREEKFLRERHGPSYTDYCTKTSRYFGRR